MNQKVNYQRILDKTLKDLTASGRVPSLFLHSCCAPCSSYVLEYLSEYFSITVFYYNPNIGPKEEYRLRAEEQKRLIQSMHVKHPISFIEGNYEPECFFAQAKGLEHEPEGGERCYRCYMMRLKETARLAVRYGMDYFTTTLSVSPLKKADWLNQIGEEMAQKYSVLWLTSDFKKKGGYLRSTELSREYGLYRQDFCGCVYSKREAEERRRQSTKEV